MRKIKNKPLYLQRAWNKRLKLHAEGWNLWAEAILRCYGNVVMDWDYVNKTCVVEGITYKW